MASTYSPNNPAARDDLGTIAAQRQGDLAENLYPFKLVYDDGTERLACDSARDRGQSKTFTMKAMLRLITQFDGSMRFGTLLNDRVIDPRPDLDRCALNDLLRSFPEAMAVDQPPLSTLLLLVSPLLARLSFNTLSKLRHSQCTLPMIKSS